MNSLGRVSLSLRPMETERLGLGREGPEPGVLYGERGV